MLDISAKQGIFKPIRLVLVDRQPIVLQGLKSILGSQQDFDVVASTSDGTSCLEALRNLSPDVVLIADNLPDLTASDILVIAKAEQLSTRLVFFTESDINEDLTAAIAAGACSAISKYAAPGPMLRSLRLMAKSGVSLEPSDLSPTGNGADGGGKIEKTLELLTPRERQIVRLVSEGMSNKEIARQLDVSQGTVKVHLHNIFQKLEITNRTVLATISLLQRTSGFSALALAFLAFAIADELKASEANDRFAHDDGPDQTGEQAGYEVWKKAILQHRIVSESGETLPLTESNLLAKASQATNPAAAMEALRAAEQFLGARPWKGGAAVGSGSPNLAAPLLRATSDTPTGGGPAAEDHLPRLAFNPMSLQGGYGTFAALAGALIYALHDPHLTAQARELDLKSIDSLLSGPGENATTKLAAITHVGTDHADNSGPDVLSHDLSRPSGFVTGSDNVAQQGVRGHTGQDAAADNGQKLDDVLDRGHASGPGEFSRGQLMGGNVENIVHRGPPDSKSGASNAVLDVASGPNRINLAAFGALAWLHLTAAAKSIPPHTLAWIYDPASNQTIVYLNPTDHVLEVGDRGLLEIHLQGIVAIAETEVVAPPDGAAVAVTLEQLEQALISATATDETVLGASESSPGTAGVWSALVDDGLSFQFAPVRTGFGTSAKSSAFTSGSGARTEESAGGSGVSAYGSSVAPHHGAAPPAVENITSKSEPANPNTGALSTKQSEIVPSGLETADSTGHGNSDYASDPGSEKPAAMAMTEAESKPGNGVGNDTEHRSQAADASPAAAKAAEAGGDEHSNSEHSPSAKEENVATTGDTDPGSSPHAAEPGSAKPAAMEMTEAESKPGNGVGNDNEHRSQAADALPAAVKAAEPGSDEHSNSDHLVSAKEAEAGENVATIGSDHGHSPPAAEPGSAKPAAMEMTEAESKPGNGVGNDNEHRSQAADALPAAAKAREPGGAEHSNSDNSGSAKEAEPGASAAKTGDTGHGNSDPAAEPGSAKPAAVEMAEAEPKLGNGVGNDTEHRSQAADVLPAAAKAAEAGSDEHSNSGHSPSAKEESVATTGGTDHGNSPHAAEPGSATLAAIEMAEAEPKPGNGVGNDNEHRSQAADSSPAGEPSGAEHSNSDNSGFAKEAEAGESIATLGNTDHGTSPYAAEPGSAKAADVEMAESEPKPGSGTGHDNEHQSQASDAASPETAEPAVLEQGNSGADLPSTSPNSTPGIVEASAAGDDNTAGEDLQQPARSAAIDPEAQPAKTGFEISGADYAFRFDNGPAPATLAAAVEPKELGNPHGTLDQKDAPQMIAETVPGALGEQAADHGLHGSHHGPASHDWLI